jgi:hypothetical protein
MKSLKNFKTLSFIIEAKMMFTKINVTVLTLNV